MKYCQHCGNELLDNAVICPSCGCAVGSTEADEPSTGLNVLSFFFPIVGWILYFVWNKKLPRKASSVAKWAWIGFAASLAMTLISDLMLK